MSDLNNNVIKDYLILFLIDKLSESICINYKNKINKNTIKNIFLNEIKKFNILELNFLIDNIKNKKEIKDIKIDKNNWTLIGSGKFSNVYKFENVIDDNTYAIKKIGIKNLNKIDLFLNEVRILSKLNHPNILRYYNCWFDFNTPFQNISKLQYFLNNHFDVVYNVKDKNNR